MNKTSNYIVGLVAVIALGLGVVAYNKTPDKVLGAQGPRGEQGIQGLQGEKGDKGDRGPAGASASPILGASSPDLPTKWFSFGGVSQWAGRMNTLIQASSTVCAIQGPSSTSTLQHASIQFALASTSAVSFDLAKGATQYATSTKIGNTHYTVAGAQDTVVASTTGSVAGDGTTFAPNEWFVVRINDLSASSGAGNAPVGVCNASWVRI